MKTKMQTLVRIAIAGAVFASLASCNTMRGVGRDVEGAGEEIQEATH